MSWSIVKCVLLCLRHTALMFVLSGLAFSAVFAEEPARGSGDAAVVERGVLPGLVSAPAPLPGGRRWQMYTRNPGASATSVSWNLDGRWLAIANGQIVRLYDFQEASPEFKIVLVGHLDTVKAVRFSPNGDRLATASLDGTVRIWDAEGREQFVYREHEDAVQDVSWHPDGDRLASASQDGTVRIWSTDGKTVAVLSDHEAPVNAVAWNPDGKFLASGCENKTIRYFSDQGVPGVVIEAHVGPVRSLAWNAAGSKLLSGDFGIEAVVDGDDDVAHMKVWDSAGQLLDSVLINQPLSYVSWSPDGTQAVAGTWRTVRLWQIGEGRTRFPPQILNLNGILPVAWRPTGDLIAAGPLILDNQGQSLATIPLRRVSLISAGLNPDGSILGIGRAKGGFDLFSGDGEKLYQSPSLANGTTSLIHAISWSPDGTTFVPGVRNSSVLQRYDPKGAPVGTPFTLPGDMRSVAWSRDGKRIAAGGSNKVVSLLDLVTEEATLIGRQNHGISQVRFTPDQLQVCSAGFDGCVRFWSLDGKLVKVLEAISAPICALAWSNDGEVMATGHQDHTVRFWDGSGELLTVVGGHGGHVETVEFNPAGTLLASGSRDNSLRIWKRDGTPVMTLRGHLGTVWGIQWTPDGREIYSCSEDGTIRKWNAESGIAEWLALFGETTGYVTLDSHGRVKHGDEQVLENDFLFFAEDDQKRLTRTSWTEIRAAIQTENSAHTN